MITRKISWQLRAFRAAAVGFISYLALSCTPEPVLPAVCESGDCSSYIDFNRDKDSNGYYHVSLDWTGEYLPYFYVDVHADKTNPQYQYNNASVVTAEFDSNTSWKIGDTLVIQQAIYSPFGPTTSTGIPLPVDYTDLTLTQFNGVEVNIAQRTELYFREQEGKFSTRRYLGPFIPQMIGDTISIYMRVHWDAGMSSIEKSKYIEKFIVK